MLEFFIRIRNLTKEADMNIGQIATFSGKLFTSEVLSSKNPSSRGNS